MPVKIRTTSSSKRTLARQKQKQIAPQYELPQQKQNAPQLESDDDSGLEGCRFGGGRAGDDCDLMDGCEDPNDIFEQARASAAASGCSVATPRAEQSDESDDDSGLEGCSFGGGRAGDVADLMDGCEDPNDIFEQARASAAASNCSVVVSRAVTSPRCRNEA
jgi:hypothetical protein